MIEITKLIELVQELKLEDTYLDLMYLKSRLEQTDKDIIIPLVGEFSSGKTSLINALTNCKKLETASKATTATIFEIRFGYETCSAEVIDVNNQSYMVDDIAELKNDQLVDAKLVRVFDTAKQVPHSTVLVDTPGLSSNDSRHKIALTSYLPLADAVFLVTDVNQQITRSLIEFVETMKLANKQISIVITKCDTKSSKEIGDVKKYMVDNIRLPIENMVCVSAVENDMQELYQLFGNIQESKNEIVSKAIQQRIQGIASYVLEHINKLINSASSTSKIEDQINEQQRSLRKLSGNIERLIQDASTKIAEKEDAYISQFKNDVSKKLDVILKSHGSECDNAVYTTVNTTANMLLDSYKKDIQYILVNLARERQRTLEAVPLQSLESLDLSDVAFNPFTYDMQLSSLGHKWDKAIGGVTKVALAVGATIAVVATAGSAAVAGSGVLAGGSAALNVADTATDVMSIASNRKTQKMVQAMDLASKAGQRVGDIEQCNQNMGMYTPNQKGLIETGINWITDKAWGKPQRCRAINNYLEETLAPEFSDKMGSFRSELTRRIGQLIHEEAQEKTKQMEQTLSELFYQRENEKSIFEQKMTQLENYRNLLNK